MSNITITIYSFKSPTAVTNVAFKFREVIAWGSMSDAQSLTGRATRGWPVYDLKAEKVAFLKDSWCSTSLDHLEKESCILKELTDAKVCNVTAQVYLWR